MKKRKITKRIILLLLTLIISMGKTSVYAEETLIRNKQNDIFAIAPLSDRTHLYNLEMYTVNNIPTYCIEIGKPISSTIYNMTEDIEEQQSITNLTKEQLEYINLVAYFGYLYQENGVLLHNEREYYMATQEIIWEYLNNIDITWTNEEDINGNKINIDSYINEIKNKIKDYNDNLNVPSTVNLKIGNTISFSSRNMYLYRIDNIKNIIGEITNSYLKLSTINNYFGEAKVVLSVNNYTNIPKRIYSNNNSQLLLSKGYIPSKTKEINIIIEGYKLDTNLVDKETQKPIPQGNASLEGAEYGLYDKNNTLVTTFTYDSTLKYSFDYLYYQKYFIKHLKASPGYKLNENVVSFYIPDTKSITLEEEVIKGKVKIITKDKDTNTIIEDNNTKYKIKDSNNNYISYENNDIFTVSNDGTLLIPFDLLYGIYYLEQVNPPKNYLKNEEIIEFSIKDENNTNIDYYNSKIKGSIIIITNKEEDNKITKRKNIEFEVYKDNELVNTYKTNEEGIYELNNLALGNYCIKEKNTKECLVLTIEDNNKKVTLTEKIVKNNAVLSTNTKDIEIPNTLSNKNDYYKYLLIILGVILYKKTISFINNYFHNNSTKRKKYNN